MERLPEVEDLVGASFDACGPVPLRFPVERGLHGVLDRQGPAGDEEEVRKLLGYGDLAQRLYEGGELPGVDVRIGGIGGGGAHERLTETRLFHHRVVVPYRKRGEVRVTVQVLLAGQRIHHHRAVGLLEVDDDVEAVDENVALEDREHLVVAYSDLGHIVLSSAVVRSE